MKDNNSLKNCFSLDLINFLFSALIRIVNNSSFCQGNIFAFVSVRILHNLFQTSLKEILFSVLLFSMSHYDAFNL